MTGRLRLAALAGSLPRGVRTRFAPAPTGYLHLGHVANALVVWGMARLAGGVVVLRIEDHDRVRSRPAFEAALLEDLAWLGFQPDEPPPADDGSRPAYRQSDGEARYRSALGDLVATGLVYGCRCSRATFARWREERGRDWSGPGCPGGCRQLGLSLEPHTPLRVALGSGSEPYRDLVHGPGTGEPAASGDVLVRDRDGNWTYHFAVVVDDLDQGIDLVVRGDDLLPATPLQLRLRRLLGGDPDRLVFLHHPLVRTTDGRKLSKSAGDTGVRELRAAGWSVERVLGTAAAAIGLLDAPRPVGFEELLETEAARRRRPGERSSRSVSSRMTGSPAKRPGDDGRASSASADPRRRRQASHEPPHGHHVPTLGPEGIDEGRGNDDPVGSGLGDGRHVPLATHPEADRHRDR